MKEFTLTSDLQSSRFWYEYGKKVIIFLFIMVFVMVFMLLLSTFMHWHERISMSGGPNWLRKLSRVLMIVTIGGIYAVILFVLIIGFIVGPILIAKEDAQKSVVQNVPS